MTRRNLFLSVLTLALLVTTTVGCDSSSDDGDSDADRFVGTWIPTRIVDGDGDQTATFGTNVQAFLAQLNADETFAVNVDFTDAVNQAGQADVNLAGTYSVNEATSTILLNAGVAALPFTYSFQNDNTVDLSAQAALVNLVFGGATAYTGTVTLTITRQ